jgi:hypothetical protein
MASMTRRQVGWMAATLIFAASGLQAMAADPANSAGSPSPVSTWKVGTPIVTYWAGPAMTDATAKQMADGGFNLVWCTSEAELDVAQRHGLRAQFHSGLISPKSLDTPDQKKQLDALIDKVSKHPAFYDYFITDEPSALAFPELGRLVAHLRARDPAHLGYINLFPTYANSEQLGEQNKQLGTKGDTVTAYTSHLRQYVDIVKPALLSYDHYQFHVNGDTPHYFLNLKMIRQFAQQANVPFLNIVQAASWDPGVRVPNGNEMRYLVYTTLAYGAQGISYYVYCCPGHKGAIALPDGTPTPIYHTLKSANREFVAIATEYQPLQSLAIYHAGMTPPGAEPLPAAAPFRLDPPVAPMPFVAMKPVKGMLLGYFGPASQDKKAASPSHVLVVNLDYTAEKKTALVGPGNLEVFDAAKRTWSSANGHRAELVLPPGGGKFVRLQGAADSK